MAYFARVENNVVQQVIVINNSVLLDANGGEQESLGVAFCQSLFGADGAWMQTFFNNNLRKNYAGVGYTYDSARDAFIAPQPYTSWILNETTCRWEAPTPHPDDSNSYSWNESTTSWAQLAEPE